MIMKMMMLTISGNFLLFCFTITILPIRIDPIKISSSNLIVENKKASPKNNDRSKPTTIMSDPNQTKHISPMIDFPKLGSSLNDEIYPKVNDIIMRNGKEFERISLPTPKNVRVECLKQAARLYWEFDPPDFIRNSSSPIYYRIFQRYDNADHPEWIQLEYSESIQVTKLIINPIFSNSNYSFKVQANWKSILSQKESGNNDHHSIHYSSPNSTVATCKTLSNVPLKNPKIISAYGKKEDHSIIVVWEPLKSSEMGGPEFIYVITWWQDTDEIHKGIQYTDKNSYQITMIDPKQKYWVQVQSKNKHGLSFQNPIPFVGNQDEEKPIAVPRFIRYKVLSSRKVQFYWEPISFEDVRGNLVGYLIRIDFDNESANQLVRGNKSEVILEIFENNVEYRAKIAAQNGKYLGDFSEPIVFKTFDYEPPSTPSVSYRFVCTEIKPQKFERNLELIFHIDETKRAIEYKFRICIRPKSIKIDDILVFCEQQRKRFKDYETLRLYHPNQTNQVRYQFTENELNAYIWVLPIAVNVSAQSLGERLELSTNNEDWDRICSSKLTNQSIRTIPTTSTAATSTESPLTTWTVPTVISIYNIDPSRMEEEEMETSRKFSIYEKNSDKEKINGLRGFVQTRPIEFWLISLSIFTIISIILIVITYYYCQKRFESKPMFGLVYELRDDPSNNVPKSTSSKSSPISRTKTVYESVSKTSPTSIDIRTTKLSMPNEKDCLNDEKLENEEQKSLLHSSSPLSNNIDRVLNNYDGHSKPHHRHRLPQFDEEERKIQILADDEDISPYQSPN
ncbi:Neuronal cell adhesion molecule [Sarcoptes scabiei]|uniref:Neuronal cell adhesion molecule n=1 Tax=Sarcoptes scabiei TaxID=52283 RepID=A0A834RFN4_SARSC|nr:Neuronal cell adhesion molecule [Sarcoptes scabiei]